LQKISIKGLAIALGTAWALCILVAGWSGIFGWSTEFIDVMASVYIGYQASFTGGIIGALWGFIDGAIGGAVIAFVYNAVTKD